MRLALCVLLWWLGDTSAISAILLVLCASR
jgi:hypothetical protein